jgi:hypothetical protein
MTILVDRVCDELLRHLYALSTHPWPESLTELAAVGFTATFVIVAWRFAADSPRGPRPAQDGDAPSVGLCEIPRRDTRAQAGEPAIGGSHATSNAWPRGEEVAEPTQPDC